jgi:molecular chaperone DnaK
LIERNTTIPTRKSETFSTAADNQTSVEVHVLQGERSSAKDNRTLGKFHLVGIPPASRGVPQVEVTFDIDANGIVNVSAKDLGTSKEQKITITSSSGLTKDEIQKMSKDAEAHSEEDRKYREEVEAKNKADGLVYATEKTLKENRDKISEADAKSLEAALEDCRRAISEGGAEGINRAVDQLNSASHKMADVLYQQAASQSGGGAAPGSSTASGAKPAEGEVIDAEYVDVDDKRK